MWCLEPECVEPAETKGDTFAMLSDSSRGKGLVWFQWYTCAEGHRYMVEVFEEEVP